MGSNQVYLPSRTFRSLVRASLRLYRNHFVPMVGVSALFLLPVSVVQEICLLAFGSTKSSFIVIFGLSFVASSLSILFLTRLISQICLEGSHSLSRAFSSVGPVDIFKVFGTIWLLQLLLIFALGASVLVPMTFPSVNNLVEAVLDVVIGALVFYVSIRFVLLPVVVILERKYWIGSLTRAYRLTSGHFWRTAIFVLCYSLLFLLLFGLAMTPAIVLMASRISADTPMSPLVATCMRWYGNLVTTAIQPIFPIFVTLYYFNMRIGNREITLTSLVLSQMTDAA